MRESDLPPFRIALVGYGAFGRFLRSTWEALPGVEVAVVSTLDDAPDDVPSVRDWTDLLGRADIDLVAISTPPNTHADIAVAALDAEHAVLVEKPVALTLADADRIIAARDRSGKPAAVDFLLRFNPIVEALVLWSRSGAFGRLTRVAVENEAQSETMAPSHWFWDTAVSGGILVEHAVHFLDIVNACVGADASRVDGRARRRPDGVADRVMAIVEHENGLIATHSHAFTRPAAFERTTMRFTFERAEVEIEGWVPMGGRIRVPEELGADQQEALNRIPNLNEIDAPPGAVAPNPNLSASEQWFTFALDGSKDDAYKSAARAVLTDVRRAVLDPAHQVRTTLESGREALRQAILATEACARAAARRTS